jgi:hypothetical protein
LYYWNIPLDGANLLIFRICKLCLFIGPILLAWLIVRTALETRAVAEDEAPVLAHADYQSR